MKKRLRKIIQIDEEKCDGCGLCIIDCAEGALAIIDGKARIVKDKFCDGLGACLGACPRDALHIIEREAEDFDEKAAMDWVRNRDANQAKERLVPSAPCGCPGQTTQTFSPIQAAVTPPEQAPVAGPGHWPVKIRLVPPTAEYLQGADVLVAADCAAAASPTFHHEFAKGKVLLIGCPKFDDPQAYTGKLIAILQSSNVASLSILRMEVPCCRGLSQAIFTAVKQSGTNIPVEEHIMACSGKRAQKTLFA